MLYRFIFSSAAGCRSPESRALSPGGFLKTTKMISVTVNLEYATLDDGDSLYIISLKKLLNLIDQQTDLDYAKLNRINNPVYLHHLLNVLEEESGAVSKIIVLNYDNKI